MKRILSVVMSILFIFTNISVSGAGTTISSSFNGLVGVPVCSDIVLEFSSAVALTESDITISPEGEFELSGEGEEYKLSFREDMLYGSLYTISTPYGSISYHTAYGTDIAKIPTNTPAGAGRTAAFGKEVSELTFKIEFMSYTELPLNKWVILKSNGVENIGIQVTNNGSSINLGLHRWDVPTNIWKGPAVAFSNLKADFTDVAYVTVKNNNVRIFVVSDDGSVSYGPNWNFSASSIANCVFDSISVDSILFGVEAGNTIGEANEESGGESGGETGGESGGESGGETGGEGSEPDDNQEADEICALNNAELVPANASIPLSFKEETILMQSDVIITADGEPVTDFTLDTVDDINYLIRVNGGMKERSAYKITINPEKSPALADAAIEFTTAYATDRESMAVRYDGNEQALSRPVEQLTMYTRVTEATYSVNSYKYAILYDIRDNKDNSLKSEKYMEFMMSRTSSDDKGYGISVFIKNGKDDIKHQVSLVNANTIPLNGASPVITLKDGSLYVYSTNNDGSVTYYGKRDISSFMDDFKAGSIAGRGTNYLTVYMGYGEQLLAEVTESGAESGDKIKVEFSSDILSYPQEATITDGDISSVAQVEVSGNIALLTLNDDLKYNSIFEIDLSEFRDRIGENSLNAQFETTPAPEFYHMDKAIFMIDDEAVSVLDSGMLTLSVPVERLRKSNFDRVDVMVALYKKEGTKQYLCGIKRVAGAEFEIGEKKTLTSETAVSIPENTNGAEYFVKVFLYSAEDGAFSLTQSQLFN